MSFEDYVQINEAIDAAIDRTTLVAESMEHNKIKRQAKLDAIRLLATDLRATVQHNYPDIEIVYEATRTR